MTSFARLILPDGTPHELRGSCTIGRHADNHLSLDDGHVSGHHALIQWQRREDSETGAFFLIDLGSTNGSHVNGRRITKPVWLKDGDTISLGGWQTQFRSDADTAPDSQLGSIGSTLISFKNRKAWLMVADIVGATRMAQNLTAKQVAQVNGSWFKACREVVEAHDGQMNQYLGDGFLSFWEQGKDTPKQVTDMLRRFASHQRKADPAFRIVLHFGDVGLGSVPTLTSLNLHGPEVNFVFRLEKIAALLREPVLFSKAAADELSLPVRV